MEGEGEDFFVGQEFNSYADFERRLHAFQEANFCLFVKGRSERSKDEQLQFKYIKFKCKHFGEPRANPDATGERALQKTYKIGCESGLHLSARSSGKLLVIYFNNEHSHPCDERTYYGYPELRRLSKESEAKVAEYSSLKAKPLLMKPLLKANEGQGTIILSRDIHNVKAKHKSQRTLGRTEEEMLTAKLAELKKSDPNAVAELVYDSATKEVDFVLIQTSSMRKAFQKFPEVLQMDCTYKVNKNQMPLCAIEAVDGEGVGQPIAYAIIGSESKARLTSMLFRLVVVSGQEYFAKTKCVLVDKSFAEIGAIRAVMPHAKVHLCSVHAERSMKKEATGDPNKKDAMNYFRNMLHAENDENFQAALKKFNEVAGKKLKDYFNDNWLTCKEVWSLKDRSLVTTLREHSTNRVESLNKVLKMVIILQCIFSITVRMLENMGLVGLHY